MQDQPTLYGLNFALHFSGPFLKLGLGKIKFEAFQYQATGHKLLKMNETSFVLLLARFLSGSG